MTDYGYIKHRAIRIAYQATYSPIYRDFAIKWLELAARKVRPKFPFLAAYFEDMKQEILAKEHEQCLHLQ